MAKQVRAIAPLGGGWGFVLAILQKPLKMNHRTLTIALLCILASPIALDAQKRPNRIFKKGQSDIGFAVGLLPTFLMDGARIDMPPLTLGYDNMLGRHYSLGVQAGHSVSTTSKKDVFEEQRRYTNKFFYFAVRNTVHCNCRNFDNIDMYGGFALGYALSLVSVENGDFGELEEHLGLKERVGKPTFNGYFGARYACSKRITILGEIGFGVSLLHLGFGFKL